MFKSLAILGVFATASNAAAAQNENTCLPMSEYQFQITNDQVIAMRDSRAPHAVVLKDGRLFVGDEWVALSKDDQQRVRNLEQSLRSLEPKIQAENERSGMARFRAFQQIARNKNVATEDWRAQMQRDKAERRFRIGPMSAWQANAGERVMEGMADSMLGMMGDMLREMQSMRRTGDSDGMNRIVAQMPIPQIGEGISTQLCKDYVLLNDIDNALTYRYNGEPLELLRVMEPNFR